MSTNAPLRGAAIPSSVAIPAGSRPRRGSVSRNTLWQTPVSPAEGPQEAESECYRLRWRNAFIKYYGDSAALHTLEAAKWDCKYEQYEGRRAHAIRYDMDEMTGKIGAAGWRMGDKEEGGVKETKDTPPPTGASEVQTDTISTSTSEVQTFPFAHSVRTESQNDAPAPTATSEAPTQTPSRPENPRTQLFVVQQRQLDRVGKTAFQQSPAAAIADLSFEVVIKAGRIPNLAVCDCLDLRCGPCQHQTRTINAITPNFPHHTNKKAAPDNKCVARLAKKSAVAIGDRQTTSHPISPGRKRETSLPVQVRSQTGGKSDWEPGRFSRLLGCAPVEGVAS
ncbi:hypothetical protein BV22DRAFT_1164563 [Leucogyrophana mollusca]|uniref:Uncharacterized protein n=1 Tax=Leucogyrophana mollusca TaxID=85980 RepID=A0ACB8BIQ9_9AGAM|nr:hypothetical protein BV22DRAFT_1164563 [Leucogyrophana mollusca]